MVVLAAEQSFSQFHPPSFNPSHYTSSSHNELVIQIPYLSEIYEASFRITIIQLGVNIDKFLSTLKQKMVRTLSIIQLDVGC
jgi:hypothetical protein